MNKNLTNSEFRIVWNTCQSAKAYNPDWWQYLTPEKEPELWENLKAIYHKEQLLENIPAWSLEIITRMMELPMCGYYAFPDNITQILKAISNKKGLNIILFVYKKLKNDD